MPKIDMMQSQSELAEAMRSAPPEEIVAQQLFFAGGQHALRFLTGNGFSESLAHSMLSDLGASLRTIRRIASERKLELYFKE